jgi:hypothetical protein
LDNIKRGADSKKAVPFLLPGKTRRWQKNRGSVPRHKKINLSPDFRENRGAVTLFQRKVNKSVPLLCKMILDFIPEMAIMRRNGNIEGFLMDWRWTQHILMQLKERQIQKDLVETTLVSKS